MEQDLKDIVGEPPRLSVLGTGFIAATGPVVSRIGYLLFSDSRAGKILKLQDGIVSVFWEPAPFARGLTFDHQGRLLACENHRVIRIEKDGTVSVIAGSPRRPSLQDPVDVVYAIDGNIYLCDRATVYLVNRDGRVIVATRDCERPAGVALAPNQQMLYITDAARNNVRVFTINADGTLHQGRVFAKVESGSVAGVKTDEGGHVWVASGDGVRIFHRQGSLVGIVPVPETPTNLTWAEGFHNVIVTSATSVYRMEARVGGTRTF